MARFLNVVLFLGAVGAFQCNADRLLDVVVDPNTASYKVMVGGTTWLESSAYGVRNNGNLYTSDKNLKLSSQSTSKGSDALGQYQSTTMQWTTSSSNDAIMVTTLRVYLAIEAVVFEQQFPAGLSNCTNGDHNDVISAFPSFNHSMTPEAQLNYLTWEGTFCGGQYGKWQGSIGGGYRFGPLVLFDKSMKTLVISSMSNFMVSAGASSSTMGMNFAYGLIGTIESVPAGHTHSTIMYAGQGVKATMGAWGGALLKTYGKNRVTLDADLAIRKIGYWTDNGAYYYYLTEPKKNYEQTMLDVKAQAMEQGIPFAYFQFDSWWYFKDPAVTLWEPRPDIFPDGMKPWLKMPLALHNRWFSSKNEYNHSWFIIEESCALPSSEDIFDHIMSKAVPWGLFLYEQDWLVTTYEKMKATQNDINNSKNWLMYMGNAAAKLNLTIQYCMPLPMHMLQTVAIPTVTHARASGDYHPGNTNWNIGLTGLFYWSIGVLPFKDDFFTHIGEEEGCPYHTDCTEPNPILETLSATLSAGPVGPSDGLGYLNKELIMRTCRSDGTILKPDEPAVTMDAALAAGFDDAKRIEVWHTHSDFTANQQFHYILSAGLSDAFTLQVSDLVPEGSGQYVAFEYFDSCPLGDSGCNFDKVQVVNSSSPLIIKPSGRKLRGASSVDMQYYVLAPVWPNGWVFFGEAEKFVVGSKQRFVSISTDIGQTGAKVVMRGAPNEAVTLYVWIKGEVGSDTFNMDNSGNLTLTCTGETVDDLDCTSQ